MKKKWFVLVISLALVVGLSGSLTAYASNSSDYATNKEWIHIKYDGYLQFVPSYKTTASSGYYLTANKNVKQGYINYTRNGVSITGGRLYTSTASSKTSYNTYWVSRSVWESVNPFAPTTFFYYGWVYF